MRIDVDGVALDVSATPAPDGRCCCCTAGRTRTSCGGTRWPRSPRPATGRSRPTCAASARPTGPAASTPTARHVVGDLLGVLDRLEVPAAHVVGHDWGAAIGWMLAALAPDRVAAMTALSVGHPAAFRAAGSRSGRSPGTCCCSSSRASPSSGCRADDFAQPARVVGASRHRAGRRAAGRARRADRGARDLPGLLPPASLVAPPPDCRRSRPDPRGLDERGPLPDRGADDRLRGVRDRALDVRPGRGRRALDAAGPPARGEPAAAGLPRPGSRARPGSESSAQRSMRLAPRVDCSREIAASSGSTRAGPRSAVGGDGSSSRGSSSRGSAGVLRRRRTGRRRPPR